MANRVTVNGIMRIFFSMVIKLSLQKEWYFQVSGFSWLVIFLLSV